MNGGGVGEAARWKRGRHTEVPMSHSVPSTAVPTKMFSYLKMLLPGKGQEAKTERHHMSLVSLLKWPAYYYSNKGGTYQDEVSMTQN